MKKMCSLAVSLACVGLFHAYAAPTIPPRYFVVCTTEMDKTEQYEVLGADEFKKLTDEVKAETALFPKAIDLARVEWMKDENLKKKIFPKSALFPRKVEAMGPPFTDQDKALKKVENLSDAQAKREGRKQDQQKRAPVRARAPRHEVDKHDKGKEDTVLKALDMVRTQLDKLKEAAPAKAAPGAATVAVPQ